MVRRYLTNFGMAVAVLGCSLGLAQAAGPKPPPISPSQLGTLVKPTPGVTGPYRGGGRLKNVPGTTVPGKRFVSGFNFEIGDSSVWFTPDDITFFIICFNTDGSAFFDGFTRPVLTSAQAELKNACDHPGGYFVSVTNPSTGAFKVDLDAAVEGFELADGSRPADRVDPKAHMSLGRVDFPGRSRLRRDRYGDERQHRASETRPFAHDPATSRLRYEKIPGGL
jgi:hypothetical protein